MSYKFLLFDLDHTLLDFDAAEDVALTQLLKEEGVTDEQGSLEGLGAKENK